MKATCANCKRTFDTDRTDAVFCSDPCRASWYRNHGATGKHADKIRFKSKSCEFCGNIFWFNEYGDRGGQRVPTYCTDRCRIAAWRVVNKAKKEAEKRAKENHRSWEHFKEQTKRQYQQQEQQRTKQAPKEPPKTGQSNDFRDGLRVPRYWTIEDASRWIMGNDWRSYADIEIRQHWRELNKKYHPDLNGGQTYKHLSTINAAFDYLKRVAWKRK